MKQGIFLIVLISALCYVLNQTSCKTSLDCDATSICCKNSVCVDQLQCQIDTRNYYIIVGIVGAFFILIVFIYFIFIISQSRKKIILIKEVVVKRQREIEELNKSNIKS